MTRCVTITLQTPLPATFALQGVTPKDMLIACCTSAASTLPSWVRSHALVWAQSTAEEKNRATEIVWRKVIRSMIPEAAGRRQRLGLRPPRAVIVVAEAARVEHHDYRAFEKQRTTLTMVSIQRVTRPAAVWYTLAFCLHTQRSQGSEEIRDDSPALEPFYE